MSSSVLTKEFLVGFLESYPAAISVFDLDGTIVYVNRQGCDLTNRLEDPAVEVDPEQIIQVLTNLISNACAAMSGGGELALTLDQEANSVRIQVSDSGTGILEENRKKIFEPFFTTKEFGKGTGLGLAVAHGINKMHGGDIALESNTDPEKGPTGTTFTVLIPAKELE